MQTLAFWVLFLSFLGVFAAQVARRVQLIAAGPNTFSTADLGFRVNRFVVDVVLQWRTIKERPLTGLMHDCEFVLARGQAIHGVDEGAVDGESALTAARD